MPHRHRLHTSADREVSDAERVIRSLYELTARYELGFPEQLRGLLSMGLERFGLDVGIVARVTGGEYRVVQAVTSEVSIGPGDTFPLADTFCSITLRAAGPVGFTGASEDRELRRHPAFLSFGLESYIGTPSSATGPSSRPISRRASTRASPTACALAAPSSSAPGSTPRNAEPVARERRAAQP